VDLPTFFTDFDGRIVPTAAQRAAAQEGHTALRERLENDEALRGIVDATFLQGSYRRNTAIRPSADEHLDVDVIVVTSIDSTRVSPSQAIDTFIPFVERYYPGKYKVQGRSIGISLADVDLDLVVTAKPEESMREAVRKSAALGYGGLDSAEWTAGLVRALESGDWRNAPLRIPDREAGKWEDTHPLEQISWTAEKNSKCGGCFLKVVRGSKWRNRWSRDDRSPKSFPLERLVGEYCPDGISSVAHGLVMFYETARDALRPYAQTKTVPFLPDYGAPSHNVLARCTPGDIADFFDDLVVAAGTARAAFEQTDREKSIALWRDLLGDEFTSSPSDGDKSGGFTERAAVTVPATARFAGE